MNNGGTESPEGFAERESFWEGCFLLSQCRVSRKFCEILHTNLYILVLFGVVCLFFRGGEKILPYRPIIFY